MASSSRPARARYLSSIVPTSLIPEKSGNHSECSSYFCWGPYRCRCHPADSQTFSPLTELFTEHTAPELLYLETRWASLISFGMTAALLKDVLPIADTTNPETVRCHLHRVATRQEADLGA